MKKINLTSIIFCISICIIGLVSRINLFNSSIKFEIFYSIIVLFSIFIANILIKDIAINKTDITCGKRYLYAFCLNYVVGFSTEKFLFIYFNGNPTKSGMLIGQLILLLSLTLTFILFKFDLTFFRFNLNFKSLLSSIFIGLIFVFLTILQTTFVAKPNLAKLLFTFFRLLIYPALFEEVLYRGFIINGLKSLNLSNFTINIIQSIIFGLVHFSLYSNLGLYGIFLTSGQIIFGYLLGLVCLKTKSLMPGIIIHAFMDLTF